MSKTHSLGGPRTGSDSTGSNSTSPPSTPSASDEVATAKALVDAARAAFHEPCTRYYSGETGPFILGGRWSEATYEALATSLESKWRLGWADGLITMYGDPGAVHESTIERLSTEIKAVALDWSHIDAPPTFHKLTGQLDLFQDSRSATRKWRLTPTSSIPFIKEPDCFFRASTTSAGEVEDGFALEVAHLNESFDVLCREIVDWTRGEGDRALLALGVKIDAKPPYQRDPRLRLVIRNVTPSSTSLHCQVYDFGHGSTVMRRTTPGNGPVTAVSIGLEEQIGGCNLQHMVADDPEASFIVEVPIGAAMFHSIDANTFPDYTLSSAYIKHLQQMVWKLDLGYLRHTIIHIIEQNKS